MNSMALTPIRVTYQFRNIDTFFKQDTLMMTMAKFCSNWSFSYFLFKLTNDNDRCQVMRIAHRTLSG